MKKSLLALSAAAIALSGMAAAPQKSKQPVQFSYEKNAELKGPGTLRSVKPSSMKKAPAKINSADDVIYSVDGERQDVALTGSGYMVFWGSVYYYENETVASHVVYGDNNEVYIFNILPNGTTDTYVKGVKDGDKVVVNLPQTVVWFEGDEEAGEESYGMNLCLFDLKDYEDENGEMNSWYFPSDESSITFSVAEDGTMTADGLEDDKLLGFGDTIDGSWAGYGVWDLSIAPFNDKPVVLPSDYEATENFWIIEREGYGQFVNFAQGGEELYFQGICASMPEAWVKASIEYEAYTATVSIAQNQYMGMYNDVYYMYLKFAKEVVDEYGTSQYGLMPDDYLYELTWDFEEETMVAKDPDIILMISFAKDLADPLDGFIDLRMVHQDSFEGVPVNPSDLRFEDYLTDYGYAAFCFNMPAMSTDGDYLLPENLSYVVYVDGDEWTFDAEEYGLPENMEEIPWNFNDYWICWGWNSDIEREADFFVEGISTLGVQSIYRYNGEETRSEIVTLDLDDPSAVVAVGADKKVKDVKYYDLSGRQVADPAAGIFVKRVTFEDGTVATFKKAVR